VPRAHNPSIDTQVRQEAGAPDGGFNNPRFIADTYNGRFTSRLIGVTRDKDMAGLQGLFGGIRQGDSPERDAEFGNRADSEAASPFARLGDPTRTNPAAATPGFDPVWGSLGPPVAQPEDPWRGHAEDAEPGPIADVEIFGDGFQISGRICTGQFPRLSDWLNMQQGFIRVQEASLTHLGHGDVPEPDRQKGTMWVRLNQLVLVAERSSGTEPRLGVPVVQKQRRKVTMVTPGYSLRGTLHVHTFGSLKQLLESPDPHFIPVTDLMVRWTSDPRVVSRVPFALINKEQLISLLDEPSPTSGVSQPAAEAQGDQPAQQRRGAA
jgi:hypothetical protein